MFKYVLSIKRVKDFRKKMLDHPEWEYATYDDFSGSLSTGYPIFAGLSHAISFASPEEAEEWFKKNSRYIDLSTYDKSSLAVQELVLKTVKKVFR